jgi:hypothetical protein
MALPNGVASCVPTDAGSHSLHRFTSLVEHSQILLYLSPTTGETPFGGSFVLNKVAAGSRLRGGRISEICDLNLAKRNVSIPESDGWH